MAGFFEKLREDLFGKKKRPEPIIRDKVSPPPRIPSPVPPRAEPVTPVASRRAYDVQIGLDFGTAFTKCICRDLNQRKKAWVYLPRHVANEQMPFLIPSTIRLREGLLVREAEDDRTYSPNSLNHIKMALERVAEGETEDGLLDRYKAALQQLGDPVDLGAFVEYAAAFLIGGILQEIKLDIRNRFPGSHENDYVSVNMAVPVADAGNPKVNDLFQKVLCLAWALSEKSLIRNVMGWSELEQAVAAVAADANSEATREKCFLYPEVSANVQCFVRSRTSREGMYLFSDTGAGTVDQSVFIFLRNGGKDQLTYLHAKVLPLGSSHIERIASEKVDSPDWQTREKLRQKKESETLTPEIRTARSEIGRELYNWSKQTISDSKKKLFRKRQLDEMSILFGGGGHTKKPYAEQLLKQFDNGIFHPDVIARRKHKGPAFQVGLPVPPDLNLEPEQRVWMKRLTVAYGLAFEPSELAGFTLPRENEPPAPDQVWQPRREQRGAPGKDEC